MIIKTRIILPTDVGRRVYTEDGYGILKEIKDDKFVVMLAGYEGTKEYDQCWVCE